MDSTLKMKYYWRTDFIVGQTNSLHNQPLIQCVSTLRNRGSVTPNSFTANGTMQNVNGHLLMTPAKLLSTFKCLIHEGREG